jgi:iduronate 2-sulfatase
LCNLPKVDELQGESLMPIIKKPKDLIDKAVLTTWRYKNHAVRSNHWRYIRYRDGSEELYNHKNDSGEHHNLANKPRYFEVIKAHKKYLPKFDALPAGKTKWKGDKLDKLLRKWKKNDSIPVWLR